MKDETGASIFSGLHDPPIIPLMGRARFFIDLVNLVSLNLVLVN